MLIKKQRNKAEANEQHGTKFSLVSIKTQRNKVRGETFTPFPFHFHLQSLFENMHILCKFKLQSGEEVFKLRERLL